jgi:hypothetical protein
VAGGTQIALEGSMKNTGHIWGRREGIKSINHGGKRMMSANAAKCTTHCSQRLTAGDRSHLMGDHGEWWAHLREKKGKKRGGRG